MIRHIVWDWNGTLFGDSRALIAATIDAFRDCGLPPVTRAGYQHHHTQPIPLFYERLAGRALTAAEQARLSECFNAAYARHRPGIALTVDAVDALSAWPGTQSLLSMYPHERLLPLVAEAGIAPFFTAIDGSGIPLPPRKGPHLAAHLERQAISPAEVLLVGDSVDDMLAAREVGVRCVIYHAGADALHARAHFAGTEVPVVGTLLAAVDLASL